jgi:hypothetical protein
MNTTTPIFLHFKTTTKAFRKEIFLSVVVMLFLFAKAFAQPASIVVNPATATPEVGTSFTVEVAVDFTGATPPLGLDAVGIYLAFDNTKLQVTAMSEQPTVAAFTTKPLPLEGTPFTTTNTNGQISYAAATTGGFPTADFNVLSITFQVIGGAGTTTPLTLRRDFPFDFTDAFRNGFSIVNNIVSGSVSISGVGCTTPSASISPPGGTTTCDGQAFNLTLSAAPTGAAPFDLTINGVTYDDIPVGGTITNFAPPAESVWPAPLAPLPTTFEDASYTLGVKFQSSVAGFVTGVRFFSPDGISAVPGNYTGQLWTEAGVLLASGTFAGVTTDDWQELLFTEPVFINAATTYIASYNLGATIKYSSTPGGLTAPVTNGSITALANGGVFLPGATVGFPGVLPGATTVNNYWADVIFAPNEYTFELTAVTDALGCTNTAAPGVPLQTLSITSVDCSTLPVNLLNLSATPNDNTIALHWSTASEINNLGFEVQRSTNGSGGWSAIGFVNGAGNSYSNRKYSFVDEKLAANRYFYRLKQIDTDQRFEYSPVVSAVINGIENFSLEQNYPNPFRNETIVKFSLPRKTIVKLSVYDMHGRLVKQVVNETKDKGTHAINFNALSLTSGIYYYKIQAGEFSAVKKMTIQ